ncbi:MAG: fibronectin type III domain-containing protein [Anaerotruncus sp.]|nr:fibronectin type III domain-containing protein [Anaerotruncus sp.]
MRLNWTDNASDELRFIIERSLDGTVYAVIDTVEANATHYTAEGLSHQTTYHWRVYAVGYGSISAPAVGTQATTSATLSGVKTVGSSGAEYLTVAEAVADVRAKGLAGHLMLELQSNYTASGETFPIIFSDLNTASTRTLTLRPAIGVTGISLQASSYGAIWFDNVAYVTIDGRPGGSGTMNEITVGSSTMDAAAFRFENDASHNTIRYVNATSRISSTNGGMVWFGTTAGATGNDDNLIDHCGLIGPATRPTAIVYSVGSSDDTTRYATAAT